MMIEKMSSEELEQLLDDLDEVYDNTLDEQVQEIAWLVDAEMEARLYDQQDPWSPQNHHDEEI